jgi:hypothetical protein
LRDCERRRWFRGRIARPSTDIQSGVMRPGAVQQRKHVEEIRAGLPGFALLVAGTRAPADREMKIAPLPDDAPVWRIENASIDADDIYRADVIRPSA